MPPRVHYARSGDLNIAYQVLGTGPADLVWTSGASSHLGLVWESPEFVRIFERLATFSRLIILDKRGTGLSDRVDHVSTLEERIDDIRALMDAAGSERAHVFGVSEGGSMAMLFAATFPNRTRSLLLWGAPPRYAWAPEWPWGKTEEEFEEAWRTAEASGFEEDFGDPDWRRWLGATADDPAFVDFWRRFLQAGASPKDRLALRRMNRRIDVRGVLPAIRVPTLVMVREDDPVIALQAVRAYTALIPDAKLVVLPGQGHLPFDIWEQFVGTIEEFVTGTATPLAADRFLATLVAADIVGSTELLAKIGDQRWRDLLVRHYGQVQRELSVYGGVEVDRAGDGFLARFDGPARAIRFAKAVQGDDATLGITLRAGIHTGEVEATGSALRGIAVHVTSRLASLAGAGEVVVSSTVRDLVAGSGFNFVDRGAHQLKGIPESRQVFALA